MAKGRRGIDIEYRSDRVKRIRSRFLAPEEEQNIDTAHEEEHLLVYWCAKEALYKLAGRKRWIFANNSIFRLSHTVRKAAWRLGKAGASGGKQPRLPTASSRNMS